MDSRERIKTIIAGEKPDKTGFWLGNPDPKTWPILHDYFQTSTEKQLRVKLKDDFRWLCPDFLPSTYSERKGKGLFEVQDRKSFESGNPFADVRGISDIEDFDWPSVDDLDLTEILEVLKNAGPYYRASGFWSCFYHNAMDLFGMENYLVNMFTNPDLVNEVTKRICDFYLEANEMLFEKAGDEIDAFFFGNDFGTQEDLICGPEQFKKFIMPWFRKFTEQAKSHGYQVILHSCGAIHSVIDDLIDMGVDCVHPLQAKAKNMDSKTLARDFKGRIAFLGGIDTQDLLVNATPEEVKEDVRRVRADLSPNLIISPSHEALLPNIPPENVEAMAQAAQE